MPHQYRPGHVHCVSYHKVPGIGRIVLLTQNAQGGWVHILPYAFRGTSKHAINNMTDNQRENLQGLPWCYPLQACQGY